jgi:hypothetical protein
MSYPGTPPQSPAPYGGPPGSSAPATPSYPRRRPPSRRRLIAAILLVLAVVFAGVSLGLSWWTISSSDDGSTSSVYFLPGSNVGVSAPGTTGSVSYTSVGLNNTGVLFDALSFLVIGIVLLSAVGAILAFLTTIHPNPRKSWSSGTETLSILGVVLALLSVVLVPLATPYEFAKDNLGNVCSDASSAGTESPCTSFWGSVMTSRGTETWGGDVGWYLMIVATVLLVVALVGWYSARREPLSRETAPDPPPGNAAYVSYPTDPEYPSYPISPSYPSPDGQRPPPGWSDPSGPYASPAPMGAPATYPPAYPAPTPVPMTAPNTTRPDWWQCPACGTPNAIQDTTCHRCGRPAPPRS